MKKLQGYKKMTILFDYQVFGKFLSFKSNKSFDKYQFYLLVEPSGLLRFFYGDGSRSSSTEYMPSDLHYFCLRFFRQSFTVQRLQCICPSKKLQCNDMLLQRVLTN